MVRIDMVQKTGRAASTMKKDVVGKAISENVKSADKYFTDIRNREEADEYSKSVLDAEKNFILDKDKLNDQLIRDGNTEAYQQGLQESVEKNFSGLPDIFSDPKKKRQVQESVGKISNQSLQQGLAQENAIVAKKDAIKMSQDAEIMKNSVLNNPSNFNIERQEEILKSSFENMAMPKADKDKFFLSQTDDLYNKGLMGQISGGAGGKVYEELKSGKYDKKITSNTKINLMKAAQSSEKVSSETVNYSLSNIKTAVSNGEPVRPGDLSVYQKARASGKLTPKQLETGEMLMSLQPIMSGMTSTNKNTLNKNFLNKTAMGITKDNVAAADMSTILEQGINNWQNLLLEDPQEAFRRQNKEAKYSSGDIVSFFAADDQVGEMTNLMSQSNTMQQWADENNWDVSSKVLSKSDAESWSSKLDQMDEDGLINTIQVAKESAEKAGGSELVNQFFKDIDESSKDNRYSSLAYIPSRGTFKKVLKGESELDALDKNEKEELNNYFTKDNISYKQIMTHIDEQGVGISGDYQKYQDGVINNMRKLKAYYKSRNITGKTDQDLFEESLGVKKFASRPPSGFSFFGGLSKTSENIKERAAAGDEGSIQIIKDLSTKVGKENLTGYLDYSDKKYMWDNAYLDGNISNKSAIDFQSNFFSYVVGKDEEGKVTGYKKPVLPRKISETSGKAVNINPKELEFVNVPGSKTKFYAMYYRDGSLAQAVISKDDSRSKRQEPYIVDIEQLLGKM